jgi:ATP-dependent Clp protease ATP-binding subunit ClpA
VLGAFTQQAHNLILLSEDEARMLGRSFVEPEHLLLALTRHGNVRSLLADPGGERQRYLRRDGQEVIGR